MIFVARNEKWLDVFVLVFVSVLSALGLIDWAALKVLKLDRKLSHAKPQYERIHF